MNVIMSQAPVFVKISKYKELTTILNKIQEKVDVTSKTIDQLEKLKDEEEEHIQSWREQLETIQGKLGTISVSLHNKE